MYSMDLDGLAIIIKGKMSNKKQNLKSKIKQTVDLLKFVLTIEDEEILRETVQSIIESLEEEIE